MTARKRQEQISFEFARSPFFRVVHSNGAWGGLTPHQELSVTFYSERSSLPQRITHEMTPQGKLGREVSRNDTNKGSIHRECEVEVLMSMSEAVNLHQWIGTKIDEWRKVSSSIPQDGPSEAS